MIIMRKKNENLINTRRFFLLLITFISLSASAECQYLARSLSSVSEVKTEISTPSVHYYPLFGAGDRNSDIMKGASRYGHLIVDKDGTSNAVNYPGEEQILFVLGGTGILQAGKKKIPVSRNDFMYIPAGMKYRISNPREQSLSLIVMGFQLSDTCRKSAGFQIANTDEVKFQVLPSHGPTTQFQLLMGTTESTRDRLAAACQMTSLFIMDFAASGTNNPHRHDDEEEIYLVLRGNGDIVAGGDEGAESRHPSVAGDVYFYSPKTLIGFYSSNKSEEEHARILAVRYKYPVKQK